MKDRTRHVTFMADQGLSSVLTFVVLTSVARLGGPIEVGQVAVIQSAGLLALALGRAIGVDVWLSRGAGSDERGPALAPTIVLAAVSVTSVWALFVIAGSDSMNLTVYALAAAGFVVLDVIRTMLMHDGASWISVSIQIVTLSFVLIAAFLVENLTLALVTYTVGVFVALALGHASMRLVPPVPSIRYSRTHRYRSVPFAIEILMGSAAQQAMFLILTVVASISMIGEIRTAQTLLGPLSLMFAGISPILMRKFGSGVEAMSPSECMALGRRVGLQIFWVSIICVSLICLTLEIRFSGVRLMDHLVGSHFPNLIPVILLCGLAVAFNGILLGVGTSIRVVDKTGNLNRFRALLLPLQFLIVLGAGLTDSAVPVAGALAASACVSASVALLVSMNRDARPKVDLS
ncbi:hypothetical protein ACH49M_03660 [Rhodococcus qingshengii]|uniref:Polysaccharide biosynthesis protein n=2 Tax=Rhodococcus qingshengii TaxID=334542 RepID=A0AAW6LFP8_RHOSG|nr:MULTISPECIES: hypothetical protein [Rhodococcus]MYV26798.1 hypothetical protein [Rhodococcus erythropolis]AUS30826.1 hypothetical protein C1M55_06685 [Rhodococcus qingshengii]MBP2521279.1 hypothetical protein [Rhodococcus sp. PvP104]MBQ7807278.1 hypothetical protein [Rhodococcus sp. (in: high G+C Gram-positive bacteria)]MBS3694973.1 hypothetical protein [Rhodococcus qingshengii]